jgi:hypothetical protein
MEEEMIFWGRKFDCRIQTLEGILDGIDTDAKPHLFRTDIECEETEAVKKSLSTVLHARILSLEFHDTKQEMDEWLLPHGFSLKPIAMKYFYKRLLVNSLLHSTAFYNSVLAFVKENRFKLKKLVTRFGMTKDSLLTGGYTKR